MAYNISNKFREVLYSGESQYDCKLYFNGDRVPAEQIQNIKISSPIIDTTEETGTMFHIGTFISQAITIKFRNLDGLDLKSNPTVYLEIGLNVNGNMEYVPIGYYMIDDLEENYQSSCEITCLDYAVKFKPNIDITQFFDDKGEIEAGALFEAICIYYGVQPGTYPNVNNNKKIRLYDSNLSGKEYVSMLAELFGGNAKMGRDGKCYIVPLKNNQYITIDALSSKNIEIGDTYEITRVCYDDGKLKLQAGGNVITVDILPNITEEMDKTAYYYLTTEQKYYKYNSSTNEWQVATDIKNTLYLRQDNLYITEQETVTNIYNAVRGFIVQNITCENRADLSLDAWDTIQYTTDKGVYYTLNNNEVTFNGTSMGKVYTNIPTGKKAETTNILKGTVNQTIRRIQTEINEIEGSVTTVIQEVDGQNQKISEVSQTVNELNSKIGDIADITTSKESTNGTVSFEKINQSEPIYIRIYPTGVNISYLYPNNGLFPNETLYATTRTLRFTNTTTKQIFHYEIPMDLLYYNQETYDEFILDYDSQSCVVNKRVGYNADGTTYPLDKMKTHNFEFPRIELTDGDYTVEVLDYRNVYLFVRLMSQNIYTTQFATKAELNSEIKQTREEINLSVDKKLTSYPTTTQMNSAINVKANEIDLSVNKKLTNYSTTEEMNSAINVKANEITSTISKEYATKGEITTAKSEIKQTTDRISSTVSKKVGIDEIISAINQSPEEIQISANKINIDGKASRFTTEINETKGRYTNEDLERMKKIILGNITATSTDFKKYDINGNQEIDTVDLFTITKAVKQTNGYVYLNGKFSIDPYSSSKSVSIYNNKTKKYSVLLGLLNSIFQDISIGNNISFLDNEGSYISSEGFEQSIEHSDGYQSNSWNLQDGSNWFDMSFKHGGNIFMTVNGDYTDQAMIGINGNGSQTLLKPDKITTPTLTQTSVESKKKNITKYTEKALDIVKDSEIYTYNFKSEDDKHKKHIGFVIGDEGGKYKTPEQVISNDREGIENYSMTSILWKAMQEQQQIIEQLQKEMQELKKERE